MSEHQQGCLDCERRTTRLLDALTASEAQVKELEDTVRDYRDGASAEAQAGDEARTELGELRVRCARMAAALKRQIAWHEALLEDGRIPNSLSRTAKEDAQQALSPDPLAWVERQKALAKAEAWEEAAKLVLDDPGQAPAFGQTVKRDRMFVADLVRGRAKALRAKAEEKA